MRNQVELREVTVSVLSAIREKFPEKTFFIKRRGNEELGICGFVHGSVYPETLYFTIKNDGKVIEVNTSAPREECETAFQSAADVCLKLKMDDSLLQLMNQQESFFSNSNKSLV